MNQKQKMFLYYLLQACPIKVQSQFFIQFLNLNSIAVADESTSNVAFTNERVTSVSEYSTTGNSTLQRIPFHRLVVVPSDRGVDSTSIFLVSVEEYDKKVSSTTGNEPSEAVVAVASTSSLVVALVSVPVSEYESTGSEGLTITLQRRSSRKSIHVGYFGILFSMVGG